MSRIKIHSDYSYMCLPREYRLDSKLSTDIGSKLTGDSVRKSSPASVSESDNVVSERFIPSSGSIEDGMGEG